MAQQVLVDVEELERLQKRVAELNAEVSRAAADWTDARLANDRLRKRAEEAESRLALIDTGCRNCGGLPHATTCAWRSAEAIDAAIEKARQEEQERCALAVEREGDRLEGEYGVHHGFGGHHAEVIRALKSTKET